MLFCRQDTVATATVNSQQLQMPKLGLHENGPQSSKAKMREKFRGLYLSTARLTVTNSLMERGNYSLQL